MISYFQAEEKLVNGMITPETPAQTSTKEDQTKTAIEGKILLN